MKLAVCIALSCLLSVVLHGQVTSGTIVSGSLVNAKPRIPITFRDTFNRSGSDPMTTNASDGIGVWTDGPGVLNSCKIALGNLSASFSGLDSGCRVLYPLFRADQSSSMIVGTLGSVGLMVRMQGTNNASGYLCSVDDSTHVSIYRVVDTGTVSYVPLGAQETVATINPLDTVTFSIYGCVMDAYVNGVSIGIQRTDCTYPTGQPGCYFYEFAGSITEFSATEL